MSNTKRPWWGDFNLYQSSDIYVGEKGRLQQNLLLWHFLQTRLVWPHQMLVWEQVAVLRWSLSHKVIKVIMRTLMKCLVILAYQHSSQLWWNVNVRFDWKSLGQVLLQVEKLEKTTQWKSKKEANLFLKSGCFCKVLISGSSNVSLKNYLT